MNNMRIKKSKNLKLYIKPTEEADKIALLKIENEKLEKQNKELAEAVSEKMKRLQFDLSDYKKIEQEHFNKVENLTNQAVELISKVEEKQELFNKLNNNISILQEKEPILKDDINKTGINLTKLEDKLLKETEEFNKKKFNNEEFIKVLDKKIKEKQSELSKFDSDLEKCKKEFDDTLEKINEENRILSKKQRDLEIYELRLRKKYPNETIIL
jgi:uncharacterized phage infection (PIP) family protein YhgE